MRKVGVFFILVILMLVSAGSKVVFAQSNFNNSWNTLAQVNYKIEEDEYGELYVPEFSEEIKNLEGKEIVLQGFIIPNEGMVKSDRFILSSLPIDACFFCGTGGPETVAEVYLKEEMKYTTRPVRVKGQLKLNKDNLNELMYVLENANFAGYADAK